MKPLRIEIEGLNKREFEKLISKYGRFLKFGTQGKGECEVVVKIEINVPSSFEEADEILKNYLVRLFPDGKVVTVSTCDEEYFSFRLGSNDVDLVRTVERIIKAQLDIALCRDSRDEILSTCEYGSEGSKAMNRLCFLRQCINLSSKRIGDERSQKEVFLEEIIVSIINDPWKNIFVEESESVFSIFCDPVVEGRCLNEEEKESLQNILGQRIRDSERQAAIFYAASLVLIPVAITAFVFFILSTNFLGACVLLLIWAMSGCCGFGAACKGNFNKPVLNVCDQIEHRFLRKEETNDGSSSISEIGETYPDLTWCEFFRRVLTQRVRPRQTTAPVLVTE